MHVWASAQKSVAIVSQLLGRLGSGHDNDLRLRLLFFRVGNFVRFEISAAMVST
jgi:hypothetical protein